MKQCVIAYAQQNTLLITILIVISRVVKLQRALNHKATALEYSGETLSLFLLRVKIQIIRQQEKKYSGMRFFGAF